MSEKQSVAPTRSAFRSLRDCKNLGEAFQSAELLDKIKQSSPAHVKPERMLRTFIQATSRTPRLLQCNMRSVLGAMLTCSEVGLEPNTPLQHAFLIPFERTKWNSETRKRESQGFEVQLIFGYPGLLDLAYRSGQVTSVHSDVVWPAEAKDDKSWSFAYGTDAHLRHVPRGQHEPNDKPVWVYAHASLQHGQAFEVMPWSEVMRIRNGSQGYQSALRAKEAGEKAQRPYVPAAWTEAPWVKHEIAMSRKTAFRNLWKWLPHSVELAGALALDEQQDRATVDFSGVIDGEASIIEGGFTETADDQDSGGPDPGAAFEDRRPAPPTGWAGVESQHAQAAAQKKAATAPTGDVVQPQQSTGATPIASERDSTGVAWDERLHASSTARNSDGTWRARRGADKQAPPPDDGVPFGRWDEEAQQQAAPPAATEATAGEGVRKSVVPTGLPAPEGDSSESPSGDHGFEAWVLDEDGEPTGEDAEYDPVTYASTLESVWQRSTNREALLEQNADNMLAAKTASPAAAKILDSMTDDLPDEQTDAPGGDERPEVVTVPLTMDRGGKPEGKAYIAAFKAATEALVEANYLDFVAANLETLLSLAPATRNLCTSALMKKGRELGIPDQNLPKIPTGVIQPANEQAAPTSPPASPPPAQPAVDPDQAVVSQRIRDMADCSSEGDLVSFWNGEIAKRLRSRLNNEGKTAFLSEFTAAYETRRAALKGDHT